MSKELTDIENRIYNLMCEFGDFKGLVKYQYWRRYCYNPNDSWSDTRISYAEDLINDRYSVDTERAMRRIREVHPLKFPKSKGAEKKEVEYKEHYSPKKTNRMIQGSFI